MVWAGDTGELVLLFGEMVAAWESGGGGGTKAYELCSASAFRIQSK